MIQQLKIQILCAFTLLAISCNSIGQSNTSNNQDAVDNTKAPKKYGAGDMVTDAVLDTSGHMWFTTLTEGVFRYDGSQFVNLTEEDGLCDNKVWSVLEDNDGILWFGTNDGLCKYDGKAFSHIPLPIENRIHPSDNLDRPISSANSITDIMQAKNGDLWIGTGGSGAYRYDGHTFTSFLSKDGWKQPDSLHFNIIQSIVQDDDGNIWFTSMTHGGISRYEGSVFTHFTKEDGLPDDMIFSSFNDRDGTLWFGALDGGLISYKDDTFQFYTEEDGLNNNMVSSFYQDSTRKLWLGSFRGSTITWFDGTSFTSVPFDKSNELVELKFITEDKEGSVWFGGRYGILWKYDGAELIDYTGW